MALLSRDPGKRPQGSDVVSQLGRQPRPGVGRGRLGGQRYDGDRSRGTDCCARCGAPGCARRSRRRGCLHGSERFWEHARTHWFTRNRLPPRALVLQSRCYVRESVPYKALDGIIEQLWLASRVLRHPRGSSITSGPKHVNALVHAFPALTWLADVDATNTSVEGLDPIQLRRDAFHALRELLGRLAAERPLVLVVDDLQVGDAESALALGDLLRQPGQPGALLIATFRTDDIEKGRVHQLLIDPCA